MSRGDLKYGLLEDSPIPLSTFSDELSADEEHDLRTGPFSIYITSIQNALLIAGVPRGFGWPHKLWEKIVVLVICVWNFLGVLHSFGFTAYWLMPGYGHNSNYLLFLAHTLSCMIPFAAILLAIIFMTRKHPKLLSIMAEMNALKLRNQKFNPRNSLLRFALLLVVIGTPLFAQLIFTESVYYSTSHFGKIPESIKFISNISVWYFEVYFVVIPLAIFYPHLVTCLLCHNQLIAFKEMLSDESFWEKAAGVHEKLLKCIQGCVAQFQTSVMAGLVIALMQATSLATILLTQQHLIEEATPYGPYTKQDFTCFIMTSITFIVTYLIGLGTVAWLSTAAKDVFRFTTRLFAREMSTNKSEFLRDLVIYLRHSQGSDGVEMFCVPMDNGTIMRILSLVGTFLVAIVQKMAR